MNHNLTTAAAHTLVTFKLHWWAGRHEEFRCGDLVAIHEQQRFIDLPSTTLVGLVICDAAETEAHTYVDVDFLYEGRLCRMQSTALRKIA